MIVAVMFIYSWKRGLFKNRSRKLPKKISKKAKYDCRHDNKDQTKDDQSASNHNNFTFECSFYEA